MHKNVLSHGQLIRILTTNLWPLSLPVTISLPVAPAPSPVLVRVSRRHYINTNMFLHTLTLACFKINFLKIGSYHYLKHILAVILRFTLSPKNQKLEHFFSQRLNNNLSILHFDPCSHNCNSHSKLTT